MTRFSSLALSALLALSAYAGVAALDAPAAMAAKEKAPVATGVYKPVSPLELAQTPEKFLNKRVSLEGTFSSFSSLGLDYKPAMRASKQYVSLLILRPDVTHHKIPLSELKLFYPREKSESVMNLEAGDVIALKGVVFSAALKDPWMDVESITVVRKAKPEADKACSLDNC